MCNWVIDSLTHCFRWYLWILEGKVWEKCEFTFSDLVIDLVIFCLTKII